MTVFQPKWRDWTPGPPAHPPQKDNSGTFGTEAHRRPQPPTRGLNKQTNKQQQTNVSSDYSPKGVPADIGTHTRRSQTDRSAKNKGLSVGDDAAQRSLPAPAWDPETATLIKWFLTTPPPAEPFEIHQGVTVLRPEGFWEYLKSDIAAGPGKARAYTGAFQKDLRRLAELFGGPAMVGGDDGGQRRR